jgi:dUTP pyrophosphatase
VTVYQPATGRPAGAGNAASASPAVDAVPVLVKRLDRELPLPARAHPGDAGVDLCAAAEVTLGPGERAVVPTGVAIALPDGYAAFVHPRSGLAARHGVTIVNAPGTVDAGYRGEIKVTLLNTDRAQPVRFGRGDRIAQLVIQRVAVPVFHEVESLPGSARGDGGFGSTGGHAAAPGEGAPGPEAGRPRGGDEIVAGQ